jgi:hypothetical protein
MALNEVQGVASVDPRYLLNTTLNYKYNMQPDVIPAEPTKIAYFGIGTRGYKNLDDANLSAPFIPSASNLDLYEPIPFRVVPINNDLTPAERTKYRMRILRLIGGVSYWCYYLKTLAIVDNRVKIIQTDVTTGEEIELDVLDANNLTPVPGDTSAEGTTATNTKVSVALTANLQITGAEVLEAVNVIYGGNMLRAVVSEIGIYTGRDQIVVASDGIGGSFNTNEAIYTQLGYHYTSLGTPFTNPSRIENVVMRINSASAFLI